MTERICIRCGHPCMGCCFALLIPNFTEPTQVPAAATAKQDNNGKLIKPLSKVICGAVNAAYKILNRGIPSSRNIGITYRQIELSSFSILIIEVSADPQRFRNLKGDKLRRVCRQIEDICFHNDCERLMLPKNRPDLDKLREHMERVEIVDHTDYLDTARIFMRIILYDIVSSILKPKSVTANTGVKSTTDATTTTAATPATPATRFTTIAAPTVATPATGAELLIIPSRSGPRQEITNIAAILSPLVNFVVIHNGMTEDVDEIIAETGMPAIISSSLERSAKGADLVVILGDDIGDDGVGRGSDGGISSGRSSDVGRSGLGGGGSGSGSGTSGSSSANANASDGSVSGDIPKSLRFKKNAFILNFSKDTLSGLHTESTVINGIKVGLPQGYYTSEAKGFFRLFDIQAIARLSIQYISNRNRMPADFASLESIKLFNRNFNRDGFEIAGYYGRHGLLKHQ